MHLSLLIGVHLLLNVPLRLLSLHLVAIVVLLLVGVKRHLLIHDLLLSHLNVSDNAALRIHVFKAPLPFQMHLALLMAVELLMLFALEEIILPQHLSLLLCTHVLRVFCNFGHILNILPEWLYLVSLSEIFIQTCLGQLIVVLTILALVVRIEKEVVPFDVIIGRSFQILAKYSNVRLVMEIISKESLLRVQFLLK